VQGCDRKAIRNRERQGVLRDHAFRRDFAKRASTLFLSVQRADVAEVRIVTGSLVGVAQPTDGLKILERVSPPPLRGMMWSTSSARSSAGMPHNSHLKPARFNVSYRSLPGI
jgi:hypothetical protein